MFGPRHWQDGRSLLLRQEILWFGAGEHVEREFNWGHFRSLVKVPAWQERQIFGHCTMRTQQQPC